MAPWEGGTGVIWPPGRVTGVQNTPGRVTGVQNTPWEGTWGMVNVLPLRGTEVCSERLQLTLCVGRPPPVGKKQRNADTSALSLPMKKEYVSTSEDVLPGSGQEIGCEGGIVEGLRIKNLKDASPHDALVLKTR